MHLLNHLFIYRARAREDERREGGRRSGSGGGVRSGGERVGGTGTGRLHPLPRPCPGNIDAQDAIVLLHELPGREGAAIPGITVVNEVLVAVVQVRARPEEIAPHLCGPEGGRHTDLAMAECQQRVARAAIVLAPQVGGLAFQFVIYEEVRQTLALAPQVLRQLVRRTCGDRHLYLRPGHGIQHHGQLGSAEPGIGGHEQAIAEGAPGRLVHVRVGHVQPEHRLVLGQHGGTALEHGVQRVAQLARIEPPGNHQHQFIGQAAGERFPGCGALLVRRLPCPALAGHGQHRCQQQHQRHPHTW